MDHLRRTGTPAVEVPYLLAKFEYSYDGHWFSFADTSNMTHLRDATAMSLRDAAFLQCWLYFGLLVEIFGTNLKHDDFHVLNGDGMEVVTATSLSGYISRQVVEDEGWRGRTGDFLKKSSPYITDYCTRLSLASALNLDEVDTCGGDGTGSVAAFEAIALSIAVLLSTLFAASRRSLTHFCNDRHQTQFYEGRLLLNAHLRQAGWCANNVTMFERFSTLGTSYAIDLRPSFQGNGHGGCSEEKCEAFQVQEDSYEIYHVSECGGCEALGVDDSRIASSIDQHRIPVVRVVFEDGIPQIRVQELTESGEQFKYIAISHVWAEGLGNPRGNSLPKCQLVRLQQRVDAVGGAPSTLFWMDTLCIPVQKEFDDQRKACIAKMGFIYESAETVLVLSRDLDGFSCRESREEMSMRIVLTNWWGRVWTLQEGVFAKRLAFQFCDGVLDADDMVNQGDNISSTTFDERDIIFFEATRPISAVRNRVRKESFMWIHWVFNALQNRRTSKLEDETTCLATLLELDVKKLLDTPKDERQVAFVRMQRNLPESVLFGRGPRLQKDGFRWLPQSWALSIYRLSYIYSDHPAISRWGDPDSQSRKRLGESGSGSQASGLLLRTPGFLLGLSRPVEEDAGVLLENSGTLYRLSVSDLDPAPVSLPPTSLVIICPGHYNRSSTRAVLVSKEEENDRLVYVKFLMDVYLTLIRPDVRVGPVEEKRIIPVEVATKIWCVM